MLFLCAAWATPAFLDDGFVLTAPSSGNFSGGLNAPTVDVDVENGVYHMYFEAPATPVPEDCATYYHIGHATSSDGVTWELDDDPVMVPDRDGDTVSACSVSQPAVVYDGTTFHLFYSMATAAADAGDPNEATGIGYATSTDGVTFTVQEEPLIDDEGQSMGLSSAAIVNDVLYLIYVWKPDFRIAYKVLDGTSDWVTSEDRVIDHDDVGVWAIQWILGPSLFCEDDQTDPFGLIYAGDDNSNIRSLAYATSGDALNWSFPDDNPLSTGDLEYASLNHWDVLEADADYVLWYSMTDPKTSLKAIGHAATRYDVGPAQPRLCPHPEPPDTNADDTGPTETGGDDTGPDRDTAGGEGSDKDGGCGACATGPSAAGLAGLLALLFVRRR